MIYSWEDIDALLEYYDGRWPEARGMVFDIRDALWNNPDCAGYRKVIIDKQKGGRKA